MPPANSPPHKSFTVFRSAAEEVARKSEQENWDNEGGHMSSTAGRVVRVPGAVMRYVVVLTRPESEATEHSFATMRDAEAFISRNTPVPNAALSSLYDRPASDPSSSQADRTESAMRTKISLLDSRLLTSDCVEFNRRCCLGFGRWAGFRWHS
jgi:hypothetical protein